MFQDLPYSMHRLSFTLLFTIRLVDFIKFPDYFDVIAVNMYFYLIGNEISFICFTTSLFIKAMGTGAFTPTNFQISLFSVVKPKRLHFFAQSNLRVRIFL